MIWKEEILRIVGGQASHWLDVFATKATAGFPNMMAPKDAFSEHWDGDWTYWVNPYFSDLDKVMSMIMSNIGKENHLLDSRLGSASGGACATSGMREVVHTFWEQFV